MMEYYKTVCTKCSHVTFWAGRKVGNISYPRCRGCNKRTTASDCIVDRETAAGRSYQEALVIVIDALDKEIAACIKPAYQHETC